MKRESFKSRLGFLLVSAGCAIGIGNVWRFPFVAGQNGGGLFVLLYLVFLVITGLPVLTMELAVGRASRKSAVLGYKALEKPGSKWHIHGWFAMLGCYLLMMYYTTVSGWMVSYCVKFATGSFVSGMTTKDTGAMFNNLLADPIGMGLWMALTVIAGFLICSRGLQNGLEKISKIMMVALLFLILLLAAHSFTLSGAREGIRFYPRFQTRVGCRTRIGYHGCHEPVLLHPKPRCCCNGNLWKLYEQGAYPCRRRRQDLRAGYLCRNCFRTDYISCLLQLWCRSQCRSQLIFITLPNVFVHMQGGRIWGTLFFLFMTFASFSTVIAVFENIMSFCMDMFGISRKKAALINCIVILVASLPCVLGYNIWSNLHLIGGRDVLDSEDFLVSNLLLPLGSLIYLLFCVTKWGWGFDHYLEEANTGKGLKLGRFLKPYFQFILPVLILIILIQGLL